MHVGAHFAVSWKTLRELAAEDWAREFVPRDSPWDRLFELAFTPSYREILIEFLSSFEFHPRRPNQAVDPAQPPPPPEEFRRIKGNISAMTEHAELLSSVRDDISEYKASGSPRMQILRERVAIHGSIAHMDDVITQAQTTRAALGSQRAMFGDVQGKVKQLSDKFPIVRGLIGSIRRKKSRDTLILSAVIAACTLFLIIYWLSK
ncbi:putative golgi SNAP receptor complex, subunit 1 [Helianthus annuus]|uniref:Golgi SNAP receptor complex member 1-2 isoform X3 n=1 Tax=Helianthus annuus TaxID=4232 RepID=UPI000B8FFAE2|nr:Golgi SNAP receptor complex member 1-2 isoform X3 [Helianthus annuus]KAJ0443920.1 putative golgi SNAP receptor complex, subunit 1 [Helianthus annuus]